MTPHLEHHVQVGRVLERGDEVDNKGEVDGGQDVFLVDRVLHLRGRDADESCAGGPRPWRREGRRPSSPRTCLRRTTVDFCKILRARYCAVAGSRTKSTRPNEPVPSVRTASKCVRLTADCHARVSPPASTGRPSLTGAGCKNLLVNATLAARRYSTVAAAKIGVRRPSEPVGLSPRRTVVVHLALGAAGLDTAHQRVRADRVLFYVRTSGTVSSAENLIEMLHSVSACSACFKYARIAGNV